MSSALRQVLGRFPTSMTEDISSITPESREISTVAQLADITDRFETQLIRAQANLVRFERKLNEFAPHDFQLQPGLKNMLVIVEGAPNWYLKARRLRLYSRAAASMEGAVDARMPYDPFDFTGMGGDNIDDVRGYLEGLKSALCRTVVPSLEMCAQTAEMADRYTRRLDMESIASRRRT